MWSRRWRAMWTSNCSYRSRWCFPPRLPPFRWRDMMYCTVSLLTPTGAFRFTAQIKLHSVLLYAPPTSSAPRTVKLFRNRADVDFATAVDLPPTQTLSVPQTPTGPDADVLEIPLNRAHW